MGSSVYLGLFLVYSVMAVVVVGVLILLGISTGAAMIGGGLVLGFGLPLLPFYFGKRADERR